MKKNYLKIAMLSLAMTAVSTSCGSSTQPTNTPEQEQINLADQPAEEIDEPFSTKNATIERRYKKIGVSITVDFPKTGGEMLQENVRNFINNSLGGNYKDVLSKTDAMLEFYALNDINTLKQYYEDMDEPEMSSECAITVSNETDNSVTYTHYHYEYAGGAHPNTTFNTAVFRKSDGKRFTWDMVDTNSNEFKQLLKSGLKKRFGNADMSDNELQGNLDVVVTDNIPLPSTPPYFANGKMIISYNRYEIASYAAGDLAVEIPLVTARKFIKKEYQDFLQ